MSSELILLQQFPLNLHYLCPVKNYNHGFEEEINVELC